MTQIAIVTGASGQDGFFLARRLLREGGIVHAVSRNVKALADIPESAGERNRFHPHQVDILDGAALTRLVRESAPDEIYNLAGLSSVSGSFADPFLTWRLNGEAVLQLLEIVRDKAPHARLYQASSGEMFGWEPQGTVVHNETSPFLPQSPYAVAKAAAHLACGTYRRAYGLRVACGILFNHESHRRSSQFLTRKVVDYVRRAAEQQATGRLPPLKVGNLKAQRDWGYARDYVDGIVAVLRQVAVRAKRSGGQPEDDTAENYRDYVLATGQLHAVWQLIDRAFEIAGLKLDWHLDADEELQWHARYQDGAVAVAVDPALLRPTDPQSIAADASLARRELGWEPSVGLDPFLTDMLEHG